MNEARATKRLVQRYFAMPARPDRFRGGHRAGAAGPERRTRWAAWVHPVAWLSKSKAPGSHFRGGDGLPCTAGTTRRCRAGRAPLILGLLAGTCLLGAPLPPLLAASPSGDWHTQLEWQGKAASMQGADDGGFVLHGPFGERAIAQAQRRTHTASALFDGLYAMAQADLAEDSVDAIRDPAYDHGNPIACRCFVTGVKWPYVWTRDLAYSTDLALAGIDPDRARNGLLFKLSPVRVADAPQGLYVMQDTGSGGSWPISTDRVVWFLGARHLLGDKPFADKVWQALNDTLAQDREYAFDARAGLYRGETSFLDWRQQTYPAWTADNVVFIAQSFALSTNVLHYDALRRAARMAQQRHDRRAAMYRAQAAALKRAINARFWRADRGLYMSYIGGNGLPVDAYDLLGTALAVTSGVAGPERARTVLANYPAWPAGSPVIWPERSDQPIYQNRAMWPFVSAYALRAARVVRDPALIAFEIRSLMRGAALAGSNMENYALLTQSTHVDDGKLSGPVVDSPRQLWSVAGYLAMVHEGVFGLEDDGSLDPELPVSLVPMLFGSADEITLELPDQRITLRRPAALDGNLLVAARIERHGRDRVVTLKAVAVASAPLRMDAPMYAPVAPAAPAVSRAGSDLVVSATDPGVLYENGQRIGAITDTLRIPAVAALQCFRLTRTNATPFRSAAGSSRESGGQATSGSRHSREGRGPESRAQGAGAQEGRTPSIAARTGIGGQQGGAHDGPLESLPGPASCEGPIARVTGAWPRTWTAPRTGTYQLALRYRNDHGPISSGITAAVKRLAIACDGSAQKVVPIVMPQSDGEQPSTTATFTADARARCSFALEQGFNMSFLAHNATFTGGEGGASGPLNEARIDALEIVPWVQAPDATRP